MCGPDDLERNDRTHVRARPQVAFLKPDPDTDRRE
jgi:hypothetical protein